MAASPGAFAFVKWLGVANHRRGYSTSRVVSTVVEDKPEVGRRNRRGEKTRRDIIDAAIAQLADGGMRALTHRLVEERAGQAQGAVKHHFGSLDGLVEAVLEHMVSLDLPLVLHPGDTSDFLDLSTRAQAVMDVVTSRPDLSRARLELYVHAAGRPQLQQIIGDAREKFVQQIAASLPGPDADLGARFVAAFIDGLILDQLSAPHHALTHHAGALVAHAGYAGGLVAARTLERPEPTDDDAHREGVRP